MPLYSLILKYQSSLLLLNCIQTNNSFEYFNFYTIIANNYGLTSSLLLIETTLEVMFFILLLIALDRRVNYGYINTNEKILILFFRLNI